MNRLPCPELPAEVVERIFRVGRPGGEPGEPLLSDKERLRCQLVCQAWRHALAANRWPLWQLQLKAGEESRFEKKTAEPPPAALWVQRVRPTVQRLHIQLCQDEQGYMAYGAKPLAFKSAAVQAIHGALLALHPADTLCSLDLTAPFRLLKRFVPALAGFSGLRRLDLQAVVFVDDDIQDVWDEDAVLTTALLRHLTPRLERLSASKFYQVQLWEEDWEEESSSSEEESSSSEGGSSGSGSEGHSSGSSSSGSRRSGRVGRAGEAGRAASSAAPAQLLPNLTQLHIFYVDTAELSVALPSLVELSATSCSQVGLAGEQLHLPQLTSLELAPPPYVDAQFDAELCCAALPALARLSTSFPIEPWGSFAALQQLTHLELDPFGGADLERCLPLLQGLAPRLRSLKLSNQSGYMDMSTAARVAAAAGGAPLTHLELDSLACLAHLSTWPTLQELRLYKYPSSITAEHVALLAAAPSLRRLVLSRYPSQRPEELQRMEELRQALPGCTVDQR